MRSRQPLIIADGWSVEPRRDDPFLQRVLRRGCRNNVASSEQDIASTAVCMARDRAFFARNLLCVPAHTAAEWICATVGPDVMRPKGA